MGRLALGRRPASTKGGGADAQSRVVEAQRPAGLGAQAWQDWLRGARRSPAARPGRLRSVAQATGRDGGAGSRSQRGGAGGQAGRRAALQQRSLPPERLVCSAGPCPALCQGSAAARQRAVGGNLGGHRGGERRPLRAERCALCGPLASSQAGARHSWRLRRALARPAGAAAFLQRGGCHVGLLSQALVVQYKQHNNCGALPPLPPQAGALFLVQPFDWIKKQLGMG